MYTVGPWLIPRSGDKSLIEIMQPVGAHRTDVWTDNIEECIQWVVSGRKEVIFDVESAKKELLEKRAAKTRKKRGGLLQ